MGVFYYSLEWLQIVRAGAVTPNIFPYHYNLLVIPSANLIIITCLHNSHTINTKCSVWVEGYSLAALVNMDYFGV